MYCGNCGTENADDSLYCKKCGKLIEPEDETRLTARRDPAPADLAAGRGFQASPIEQRDDGERRVFSVTPTLKFVIVGYVFAALAAVALVAVMSLLFPGLGPVAGVIAGLAVLVIPALYHLRQRLIRYTLTDAKLEIDSGLLARTTTNVPLGRVQDVTVRCTVSQRLTGVGDVVVDNSGSEGGTVVLKNIDSPRRHADLLLREMQRFQRR